MAAVAAAGSPITADQAARVPARYADTIERVLFTEDQLQAKVKELAAQISADHAAEDSILVVGLLKGAFLAVADVARNLTVPNKVDFMVASSYGGKATTSSGTVRLKKDLDIDPAGKSIVIVEDLIDTGNTLQWVKNYLYTKGVKSVKICCIFDKKCRREAAVEIDYAGFECPDEFVVGYGMDFDEEYRTLPFVGVLKPSAYA
jgi:hypoxanthine phosphoribosyltransferase